MRPYLTPLLISLIIILSYSHTSYAQVYIWGGPGDVNSEFAYGLNNWTTSGYDTTMWVWDEDAIIEELHCFGYRGGLLPNATSFNGAALFFSAKMHSVDGYAYPHSGELSSPIFSTKDHNSVAVHFNQDILFWNPENVSLLQVSTDCGISWSPEEGIEINPEISGKWNVRCDTAQMLKLIDITEWAANQDTVQIRFVWDGAYYYWLIDDVYVVEKPEVELAISSTLYDPISAQIPYTQIDARASSFGMEISHNGTKDVLDANVGINITDMDGYKIYEDSIGDIALFSGETSNILFENIFIPSIESYKKQGYHYINYWVKAPGENEFNVLNNKSRKSFYLTEGRYDCAYNVDASYRSENESFGAFSIFHTGSAYWEEWGAPIYAVDSVRLQVFGNDDQDYFISDIKIYLYKISNEVESDFSNWDSFALAQFNPNEEAHPQMELIAFGFEASYMGIDYDDFNVGLYDMEFKEYVILEPNSRYLLMAYWDSTSEISHGVDEDIFYNATPTCGWYYSEGDNNGSHWNFDPWYGWRLAMDNAIVLCNQFTSDLPEKTLTIFPNPVKDWLHFEIDYEGNMKNARLFLSDMNGRILNTFDIKEYASNGEKVNVKDLPSGNYILSLVTKEGVAEKKVVILH